MVTLQEAIESKRKLEAEILQLIRIYEYHYLPITAIELQRLLDETGAYARTEAINLIVEVR